MENKNKTLLLPLSHPIVWMAALAVAGMLLVMWYAPSINQALAYQEPAPSEILIPTQSSAADTLPNVASQPRPNYHGEYGSTGSPFPNRYGVSPTPRFLVGL